MMSGRCMQHSAPNNVVSFLLMEYLLELETSVVDINLSIVTPLESVKDHSIRIIIWSSGSAKAVHSNKTSVTLYLIKLIRGVASLARVKPFTQKVLHLWAS